jgi:hypothetical protein
VAVNEHVPTETTASWIEFAIDPGSASAYLWAFAIFGTHTKSYVRNTKPSGTWSGQGSGNFSAISDVATEFRVKYADYGVTYGDTIKLAIDRNNGSSGPEPRDWYGYAAFWPQGAVVYYGSPVAQPTTWGDVHLGPSGPTTYELTVNSSPVSGLAYTVDSTPAVTGTPITLDSGSHTITMPSTITVGADTYDFAHWEDSSTNPVRIISLYSNTVLTATYELPTTYELTVNSIPVSGISYTVDSLPAVTGTPITLDSGSHTITMPSTITVGLDTYGFAHWEILYSTNPVRTIDLQSDTVLTATYSKHVIDGVISSGEYADGIFVPLVGPYPPGASFPPWETDAYISWDTEYLYVAVNEPVPAIASGHASTSCWIEFQFNTSTALHSYVLFGDGTPQHVLYPLPSGGWGWDVPSGFSYPYPWYAATNTATEFQVKYTDFGIAYGHMLKMSIDRGKDDFTNPPLGECSVWPNPCTFYPTADASTWGSVPLAPLGPTTQYSLTVNSVPISGISFTVDSQSALTGTPVTLNNGSHAIIMPSTFTSGSDVYSFAHWENGLTSRIRTIDLQSNTVLAATYTVSMEPAAVVDGIISPGEYDGGKAVQLVGRTDPLWTVDVYMVWNNEYLYVAVNEPVPATTGHQSWIEFAIDPGSASTYLYAFTMFDNHDLSQMRNPKPPTGGWGTMAVSFIAASNTATEFRIKYTDFGASFGDTIKMAIDRNQGPAPPPPYGFAAFWPQNAIVYTVPNPTTWGDVYLAQSALYITPSSTMKQFGDVGATFEVTIMADDITDLFGFDLNITWDNTLITFDHASYAANLDFIWGAANYEVTRAEAGTGYYKFVALSLGSGYTGSHALLTLGFLIQDPETNWKRQTPLHFETDKLSDSGWQPIVHTTTDATYEIFGCTPTLSLGPLTRTCREINEEFEITVAISNCESVTGFDFEIYYNTALLDYVSGTVNLAYGTGTITPDEANGKVTGTTTGSASGSLTLVTIRFKAAYSHIWKDELTIVPPWQNIWTGTIYIQSATLKYPSPQPDRTYIRGGLDNKINVGADVTYTWSPIQGDVDLDGDVDIIDLRDVSTFYDGTNADLNLTGGSNLIDIFDLIVIAGNFGFSY